MEDENNENPVKKGKKQKTGEASLPKNKNCTVDDGSLKGVKKEKKKVKRVEAVVEEEQSWDGGVEKKEEKKKKKKKGKVVTDSLNGSDVMDGNDRVSKKKTKKKRLTECESGPGSVKEDDEEKRQRKEKKGKNNASLVQPENVKMEKIRKEEKVPKKVKKEKNTILVASTEETEEHIKKKKKKKKNNTAVEDGINVGKKKAKLAENGVKLETPEGDNDEVEEVTVKKKKKKETKTEHKAATKDENEVETQEIKGNKKKNKASGRDKPEAAIKEEMEEKDIVVNKRKDKSTKSEIIITEEEKTKSKKKKKGEKEKRRNALEVNGAEETESPKKKKKRKKANVEREPLILKCEEVEEEGESWENLVTAAGDTSKKSKRKKSSSEVETRVKNLETGAKKKKKKFKEEVEDQHELPQVDVVFLSEKSGNTDEVSINQERRHALQMEIDKASQPVKPAKPSGFGQWSTAQFDSSEKQQKFLRLMGGFKKGFQPAAASTGGSNMAMGKDVQQKLQQGLLGEFERAQSRRMDFSNRGAGLGFTAPSNTKFFIDVNASRSVRFDD